ncbi:Alpha/Beta hydrolase protein [Lentinula raphanica]|uniref:Alpha/Beta hydrolase protein n=1 Tax=Lentinula raphanica TaxID=153919 RepID=A0AA38P862_9AGAR|nr:Alpha/Beta hydrolase protein [Lentinula raphanica]
MSSKANLYTSIPPLDESKFALLSWPRFLWMKAKLMLTPLIIAREVLLSPFVSRSKGKPLSRIVGDTPFRFITDYFSAAELQYILGTSVGVYSTWARQAKLPMTIEEMRDGGKLMWIGPKRTDRMLLYCHGGAYIFSVQIFTISFWRYIQQKLEERGLKVGIAIMSYSLVPVAQFPTPLWQTSHAINHLLTTEHVHPSNLVLVGDSAGGNLVSQVLSSMLHPLFEPRIIPEGTRLRGAYMMSPWVSLTGVYYPNPTEGEGGATVKPEDIPSFTENDHCDIIGKKALVYWGHTILDGSPNPSLDSSYLEPINASFDWYQGLPSVVERVFVSTGGGECLRDADRLFYEKKIKPFHDDDPVFFEDERGVHNDPFFDFNVADGPVGGERQRLTPRVVEWVRECFEE